MSILDLSTSTLAPVDPTDVTGGGGGGLHHDLRAALSAGDERALTGLERRKPVNARDRFLTLLDIYDLHTAPLDEIGDQARLQHHPVVAGLKSAAEQVWIRELDAGTAPAATPADPVATLTRIAARDRLPGIYRWLARDASWAEVVRFLALEGGPDAGFDDLVAACQAGLSGPAKLELARNYWDEMGNGDSAAVHTTLHDELVAAIGMPRLAREDLPTAALARAAMGGLLTTNRWLQPEMLGALGLIELQAGPRCRLVLQAFDRLGAPAAAYPFYEVHAEVDPRHGRDWLDNAITPAVAEHPGWGEGIIRGARWRNTVTNAFFQAVAESLLAA
jgi:hypothetical protein